MAKVAEMLGLETAETVRTWARRAQVDDGQRPGTTIEESEEIKRLKREAAEFKRANGVLEAVAAFFGAEPDRPSGTRGVHPRARRRPRGRRPALGCRAYLR
ncbi:hypothetical protein [Motilibacter aurantiacus]|uniref:hypothetical protein n=1 Tax=Motilibacter aurantiacus TaxID=2714955 RepID=UPI0014099ECA|nr:hypothetical protein [Motilibacter aurantiacus]